MRLSQVHIYSVNGWVKVPEACKGVPSEKVRAYPQGPWFVVQYELPGSLVKVYYNQDGRECFRVTGEPEPAKTAPWWKRF